MITKEELRESLERDINTLPEEDRRVLELRYGTRRLTIEETAQEIGMSVEQAVAAEQLALSRLRHVHARRNLRDYLGE